MDEESRDNRRQGFLIGLVVGAVVGSVVTVWLGGKLRRQMRRRGISTDRAGDFVAQARERGGDFLSRMRDMVRQASDEGRRAADKARADLEERYHREDQH